MANYPTSVSTDANLFIAKNNLSTTLNGAINNSVTTVTVATTTGFPTAGYITVDAEAISYTGTTGTTFTGCTRGADGTTAASHADLANVYHNVVAAHHNVLKDEVIATEQDLFNTQSSITPVTATNTATSLLNRLAMFAQRFKDMTGLTNWYDTFTSFPISKGGTNSTTTLNNNRVMQSSGGAIVEAAAITASRLLSSDANGIPVANASLTSGQNVAASGTGSLSSGVTMSMNSTKITSLANGTVSADAAAFGQIKLIQAAIQGTDTATTTTTSSTPTTCGPSATITPSSSSNRVMIHVSGEVSVNNGGGTNATVGLYRAGSLLAVFSNCRNDNASIITVPCAFTYVDSPATTSSTAYTIKIASSNNSNTVQWNRTGATAVMTVEEIV